MEINGKIVFETIFGSQVYGTETPESDTDYKGVYLPTLKDLVMNKQKESIVISTGDQFSRNSKNDVDIEYKSLKAFIKDAIDGQTYALDMIFIPEEFWVEASPIWREILENRHKLISRNIAPYIGYCRRQAGKYGLKGSRLGELKRVIKYYESLDPKKKIMDYDPIETSEFVSYENLVVVKGSKDRSIFLNVLGKKFQETLHIERLLESLRNTEKKYGRRAELAMLNKGVDWKAVSHAFRCCYQLIEYAQTQHITFPLKEAEKLKEIKLGKYHYEDIQDELYALMEEAKAEVEKSDLPENPDKLFWDKFVTKHYLNQ